MLRLISQLAHTTAISLTTPSKWPMCDCTQKSTETKERSYPVAYSIVADLGDQRAFLIICRGLRKARKFVAQMSRKYPTEAVYFRILRNPRPPTMPWKHGMKQLVRAICAAEGVAGFQQPPIGGRAAKNNPTTTS